MNPTPRKRGPKPDKPAKKMLRQVAHLSASRIGQ